MANDLDFTGKTILISGASSGIGAACARWLAARGAARLVLVDRAASSDNFACRVEQVVGDVSDEATWQRVDEAAGPIHAALLNAGISDAFPIVDGELARWRRMMAVNVDGVFLGLRSLMRAMGPGGSIVVTASAAAFKAEPGVGAYAASKAAVVQLAKVAAREGAAQGIRVNAIAPGGVDTPIWDTMAFFADMVRASGSREAAIAELGGMATPSGRYASAEEIAGQIGFLLSDLSANMTGAVLRSDGGYTL